MCKVNDEPEQLNDTPAHTTGSACGLGSDDLPLLVRRVDDTGRSIALNAAWRQFTGWSALSEPHEALINGIHPDDRLAYQLAFEAALHTRTTLRTEYRLRRHDGQYRWMFEHCSPLLDAAGRFDGYACASSDMSEQKQATLRLAQKARLFNLARVVVRDMADRITEWSDASARLFGWSAGQALGCHAGELLLPQRGGHYDEVRRALLTDGEWQGEVCYSRCDGTSVWVDSQCVLMRDEFGAPTAILEILDDISRRQHEIGERRRAEQSLLEREAECNALLVSEREARVQAESTAQVREQFLSIVSHELRSPLNGIQSWAHVLENQLDSENPAVRRALAGIRTGVDQQVRLIEDLLDVTAVMSGKLGLTRRAFVLREAIEAALADAQAARDRNINIEVDLRLGDERMGGDPVRMRQIVGNLLSNAIKFNQCGGTVWLSAWVVEASDGTEAGVDRRFACVSVRDNGKGIDRHFLKAVFEPFRPIDHANTRRTGGIGLGLALVKRLVELHGGTVDAQSGGEGQGAEFTISLPLQDDQPEPYRTVAQGTLFERFPSLDGVTVMLIDDQQEARESLTALLHQAGAAVLAHESAQAALQCLDELGPGRRPHVLICDIAMPGEDGYRTLQRIRDWERRHRLRAAASIPAIALTAFAQTEDRMRALASGFQMHFAKPVVPSELLMVLAHLATTAGHLPADLLGPHARRMVSDTVD